MYVHVYACICMYVHVSVGMCRYSIFALSCAQKVMHMLSLFSKWSNQLCKRHANHSKTALSFLGLEHPTSGALSALCTTKPARLTK